MREGDTGRHKPLLDPSVLTLKDFFHSVVFLQQLNEDCCLSTLHSMAVPSNITMV